MTKVTRTAAAIASRRSRAEQMLDRVGQAITQMRRDRTPIATAAVARRAQVSRTFLYQNAEARVLLAKAAQDASAQRSKVQQANDDDTARAWKERALNAEDAVKAAGTEIRTQRTTIGQLLGKIQDLELDLPEGAMQRLVTENTTLKQQLRELTESHRLLDERLRAARDNNRFLDKRVADFEAELAEHHLASARK